MLQGSRGNGNTARSRRCAPAPQDEAEACNRGLEPGPGTEARPSRPLPRPVEELAWKHGRPRGTEARRTAGRSAGWGRIHASPNPEGDAGRRETSGCLFDTVPVSRRPAEGSRPYQETPPFRFCVTVAPPASTPDLGAVGPSARLPRGEREPRQTAMGGLVRTGPRIGPGSGCSWAPTRDRPMAPSRDSVVSRTAPGAMATGPPTREPPHLPTSLAGRSPEKLPRLVREVSGRGCRIFCL